VGSSTRPRHVVLDASAAVNLLIGEDHVARRVIWAVGEARLLAPAVFPFEVTNVVRRQLAAHLISPEAAQNAWEGLGDLAVELWPWEALAERVWQLRGSITSYDASYIALAELMECPLVTTDSKLAAMAPTTCQVELASG